MSEYPMLEDLGTVLDPPGLQPPADLRQRVLEGLGTGHPRHGQWLLPTSGVAAIIGLVVVLTAGLLTVLHRDGASRRPVASAEATRILLRVAQTTALESAPAPRPDQFVLTESRMWYPSSARGTSSGLTREWRSVDGTRDGLVWTESPNAEGRTETPTPGCRDGRAPQWGERGTLRQDVTRPCRPDPAYVPDAPTTAGDMLSYLSRTGTGAEGADERAFAGAGTLLGKHLPAPSRAALFEAIALIPGVTVVRDVVDAAGRTGVAIVFTGTEVRYEMIFDPRTFQYLGWQLEPVAGGPVGSPRLRHQALMRVAIVDAPGQLS